MKAHVLEFSRGGQTFFFGIFNVYGGVSEISKIYLFYSRSMGIVPKFSCADFLRALQILGSRSTPLDPHLIMYYSTFNTLIWLLQVCYS